MTVQDLKTTIATRVDSATRSAKSGMTILERDGLAEPTSLRTAANQFRQAAKELDEIDGLTQALHLLKMK